MLWAKAGVLNDEPLLNACLHDERHDRECEGPRAKWLWELIDATGAKFRFRAALLNELRQLPDESSAFQLCDLALLYAVEGDRDFRGGLYEIVEQMPVPSSPQLGESEILQLDGESGVEFIAAVRGRRLHQREWQLEDGFFASEAADLIGEERFLQVLMSTGDQDLKRFRDTWQAIIEGPPSQNPAYEGPRETKLSHVSDVLAAARSEAANFSRFRGWGTRASDEELRQVLNALWAAHQSSEIISLLKVFSNRAMPEFDERILELTRHPDRWVRHWTFNALRMISHPRIREAALEQASLGIRDRYAACLFIRNYEPGDEEIILRSMEMPEDGNQLHWLLSELIDVLKLNPEADPSRLAIVIYSRTPCENCRLEALRLLLQKNAVPDWMAQESRFDSNPDCRALLSQGS